MRLDQVLDVWGGGQLLAFSAFDGETDYRRGLVLRTMDAVAGFEIKRPTAGGALLLDLDPPTGGQLGGDFFTLETRRGNVRGALVDARHLLAEGPCVAAGLPEELRSLSRDGRVLLGTRDGFDAGLIAADMDELLARRRAWLETRPEPAGLAPDARRTYAKACSQLKAQFNSPEGLIRRRWTTPDRWPHRNMWLWDSVFHAAGLRRLDPAAARESLEAVFLAARADGFIPLMASPDAIADVTQPPLLALGVQLIDEIAPDETFVRFAYGKNAAFLRWLFAHRDTDGFGLLEWHVTEDKQCRSGESGMDNSPRFDVGLRLDAPDFNAYLAQDCEIMAGFAARMGLAQDEADWRGRAARLNRLMNERLWDEKAGLYVDYNVERGERSDVLSAAGFLPLLSGAPSPEQAARLLAQLSDPGRFGAAFPVPQISRACPRYYAKDMWRGPTWINMNWLIARGLERYGYRDEAQALRRRTREELEKNYLRYGTFFEFYDDCCDVPPTALLRKGACDPGLHPFLQTFREYGWSADLYIDLLFIPS